MAKYEVEIDAVDIEACEQVIARYEYIYGRIRTEDRERNGFNDRIVAAEIQAAAMLANASAQF